MYKDKAGTIICIGDEVIVESSFAKKTYCKAEKGWIVQLFMDYDMVIEVIVEHKDFHEAAFFPIWSITKSKPI
jgi:hypothetical protein